MATIRICDNILEKDSLRTIFAKEGGFKTIRDAVESLAGNDAYEGKLVECYDPETDTTTWEPIVGEGTLSVSVFANGEEADIEYEIRDADEILIIVLPAGGRNGAGFFGALIGVIVGVAFAVFSAGFGAGATTLMGGLMNGLAFVTPSSIVMGALAGGIAGYAIATSLYDAINGRNKGSENHLEGKSYPGVKGSKNQSLLGKNYPFILGRHLITPPYIAAPYSRSEGKFGEDQTISLAYTAGYAPLRLTEFRLGDLILAYNKPIKTAPNVPTIMCGKFEKPATQIIKKYAWRAASQGEIDSMVLAGTLVRKTETYQTYDWVTVGNGYYGGYTAKIATNHERAWYESRTADACVLNVTLYNPGTVMIYAEVPEEQEERDTGEILQRWKNNDIELEILQQNPDEAADWGTVVTQSITQDEINATPLYVIDGVLGQVAQEHKITYKGCMFSSGFRNNTVRFTRANPMKIEVELEASNGIYRTYQYTNDNVSQTRYESIPCWYAIQWRPYGADAKDSNVEKYNADTHGNPWRTFEYINRYTENGVTRNALTPITYTQELHDADIAAHTGNTQTAEFVGASSGWIGCPLFNLGGLIDSCQGSEKDRLSMQRFTAVVDLSTSKPSLDPNTAPGSWGGAAYLRQQILNLGSGSLEKGLNTNGTIEVRVVRVSPCYLNETISTNEHYSAKQYVDVVKWNSLTTFTFDKEALEKPENWELKSDKITRESELRKLCIVALKAKADTGGNIQNQLGKFNVTAESFSPTFTERKISGSNATEVVIQPEGVTKRMEYYKAVEGDPEKNVYPNYDLDHPITKEQYEEYRQNHIPAIKRKLGNNYTELLLREIFAAPKNNGRTVLTAGIKAKYVDNNAASSSLLALIGKQNGIDALGYEDLNLDSFSDMYDFCKSVYDDSTYPTDEVVVNDDMSKEVYNYKDPIRIKYTCNACVTNSIKVETLLQKCLATGRALYVRDENNRIKVVVDKPRDYPVMLINQQNVISGTNTISYDALPAGLQFNYEDETDGFIGHALYVMNDGEDYTRPSKEIESYSIDFVTNRHQLWSLGRYVMASRSMQREILTRKIGPEGFCAEIGDLVKVSDDTILIGTDLGARVKELIEDSDYIYGIVTDETWNYTGETETEDEEGREIEPRCVQGAELLQPTKYKMSRVVSYRAALPGKTVILNRVYIDGNIYSTNGSITVDGVRYEWIDNREERKYFDGHYYDFYFDIKGEIIPVYMKTYKMVVGETNVMLFDKKVAKSGEYAGLPVNDQGETETQLTYYKPELEDIVAFGKVGKVSSLFTITKIKPDKDFNFDLTLVQYNDQIFCAGQSMPEFEANMTIPDRSGEENYPLSESLSPAEVQQVANSNVSSAIKLLSSGEAAIEPPNTPIMSICKAEMDKINVSCLPLGGGAKNSVAKVFWQVAKTVGEPQDSDWIDMANTPSLETAYVFNREIDGYPEREDLFGTTVWRFRAKVRNSYNQESEWSDPAYVDVSSYGTWQVGVPIVNTRISDRTITLMMAQPARSDNREAYGSVRYQVQVQRHDDAEWFKPSTNLNPYPEESGGAVTQGNEGNYKDGSGYVISDSKWIQTMPLEGQADKDIHDTLYRFRAKAFNEAHESEWTIAINATALCTNIRDIVQANETAKQAYIRELSAISANIGTITQGSFGNSQNNLWDLSTFIDTHGQRHYEGRMRVGGQDQYLAVDPVLDGDTPTGEYRITFRVGNFEISSTSSNINGELIIQKNESSLDRTRITPTGTYHEHRENMEPGTPWTVVAREHVNGVETKQVFSDRTLYLTNQKLSDRRKDGLDIGNAYLSEYSKVFHFDTDVFDQNGNDTLTIADAPEGSHRLVGDETEDAQIDFTPAILAVAPYSPVGQSLYGQYSVYGAFGNAVSFTVDFWIQYIYAENQVILDVGTPQDRIQVVVSAGECYFERGLKSEEDPDGDDVPFNEEIRMTQMFRQIQPGEAYNNSYLYYVESGGDYISAVVTAETFDDMVEMGLYEQTCPFNEPAGAHNYIKHDDEKVEFAEHGIEFEPNSWLHIAVAADTEKICVYLNDIESPVCFDRNASASQPLTVKLNEGANSFILDELMVDATVKETLAMFKEHTAKRTPWAKLSDDDAYFVLTADDPAKIKTNIFEADAFRAKVLEIINEYHNS
ncbi:MAG: hypothetical protein J6V90_07900 [Treponema sp.]|nr:hypothetical protein [Treponema sp.]